MATSASHLQPLVDSADVPGLLRAVDGCSAAREWEQLVDLARRCRDAIELGKQLWPVAMHIEYRLAYEAPGPYAAGVLRPGAARFALGPLTEVAASTHSWSELADDIADPASAAAVAQERVIRGEDLRGALDGDTIELPLRRQTWEPDYALPTYRDREALFPGPDALTPPVGEPSALAPGRPLARDPGVEALETLVEVWTSQSEGRVSAAVVEGDAAAAIASLTTDAVVDPIAGHHALAWLQWCGASGGAYGHRRGGAAGRFAAWWTLAALAGEPWPDQAGTDERFARALAAAVDELEWFRWSPASGPAADQHDRWHLHLAVHDPADGLAWAVAASDRRADEAPSEGADASC